MNNLQMAMVQTYTHRILCENFHNYQLDTKNPSGGELEGGREEETDDRPTGSGSDSDHYPF
jgi:hypothetical protein